MKVSGEGGGGTDGDAPGRRESAWRKQRPLFFHRGGTVPLVGLTFTSASFVVASAPWRSSYRPTFEHQSKFFKSLERLKGLQKPDTDTGQAGPERLAFRRMDHAARFLGVAPVSSQMDGLDHVQFPEFTSVLLCPHLSSSQRPESV